MDKRCWDKQSVEALFEIPFFQLIHQAYAMHLQQFNPTEIELCTLASIKTGACPEDCAYCPQSGHYQTGVKNEKLLDNPTVLVEKAKLAKKNGAKRFCIAAAWKYPPKKDFPKVISLIRSIKALGLETCATLGTLDHEQCLLLKEAGLDYYNHNLDSSQTFYQTIINTRTYQERINTLMIVSQVGLKVCCGGILGMGESRGDRISLLLELNQLPDAPTSIPINKLIPIPGTPLENTLPLDHFEFVKTIAVTRIMFPNSFIRLSAGRESMSEEAQAWCFMAGVNSIWIGDQLITASNTSLIKDKSLLKKLNFCIESH